MAFDIKNFLNDESKKEIKKEIKGDFEIVKIPADKLIPNSKNFYDMIPEEIEALKETIELVGVQENLVVKPLVNGEYEILSGHKRHRAVTELIAAGKDVSNMLPCKIEDAGEDIKEELILIFTNSTQRERTDYCKMYEIQRVRELLEEYAKSNELTGRKRDIIAGILNISKSTVGKLDNIRRHIIPEFMEEYKAGNISTHAADKIAGADEAGQRELLEKYRETGTILAKEVKEYKETQLPGQMETQDYPEYLPDVTKAAEPEPKETEQEPREEPREEQQAEVTIQRQQDHTDRTSLIISGKINSNKEYNGMNVKYFSDAVTNSDLFDTDFWSGWVDPAIDKVGLIEQYKGIMTAYTADTGEPCQVEITDVVTVKRTEAAAVGKITIRELIELVDALVLTKIVQVKTQDINVAYWVKEMAKDISRLAIYATQDELNVLQDIVSQMKERAGK